MACILEDITDDVLTHTFRDISSKDYYHVFSYIPLKSLYTEL